MPDTPQYFLFAIGKMFFEPMLEKRRDRPREANNRVTCKSGAGPGARLENFRDFVISQPGNDRRNHYSNRNSCAAKLADCIEARLRRRRAWLKHPLQFRIERRHGNVHRNSIVVRKLAQEIGISRNEPVLGDDRHRVAELGQHLLGDEGVALHAAVRHHALPLAEQVRQEEPQPGQAADAEQLPPVESLACSDRSPQSGMDCEADCRIYWANTVCADMRPGRIAICRCAPSSLDAWRSLPRS